MVTVSHRQYRYGIWYEDVRLLSTDSKPTAKIHNGSTCIEIDTGKKYLFDEDSKSWNEVSGSAIISASGVEF